MTVTVIIYREHVSVWTAESRIARGIKLKALVGGAQVSTID